MEVPQDTKVGGLRKTEESRRVARELRMDQEKNPPYPSDQESRDRTVGYVVNCVKSVTPSAMPLVLRRRVFTRASQEKNTTAKTQILAYCIFLRACENRLAATQPVADCYCKQHLTMTGPCPFTSQLSIVAVMVNF